MQFGVVFPQRTSLGGTGDVRRYVLEVESAGFDFISIYDHVLGADTSTRKEWVGGYTSQDTLHEVFVLLGYIASLTRLELMTGVLVLPQRQTALVAKQTAELDWLLEGKFRLGVGVGWNHVEFESLGMSFANRGQRMEEQIEVLRLLWTQEVVDFSGQFHRVDHAGINPLPIQQPIPIWIGGGSATRSHTITEPKVNRVLERIGRIADGWLAPASITDLAPPLEVIRHSAERSARDPKSIKVQVISNIANESDLGKLNNLCENWSALGVSHVAISTSSSELSLGTQLELVGAARETISRFRDR